MLKLRLLTAAVLIPAFLGLFYAASPNVFAVVTAIVMILAAYEWSNLIGFESWVHKLIYLSCFVSIMIFMTYRIPYPIVMLGALLWWLAACPLLLLYVRKINLIPKNKLFAALIGCIVLIPAWEAVNLLRYLAFNATIYLFILIWGADTVAYFAGKAWGKHRLALTISPGKSVEGAIAALVFAIMASLAVVFGFAMPKALLPWIMLTSVLTVTFSIIGDLFESLMKREANLKDSSNLLPGHGGILDRIDSLTAAAPVYLLALMMLMGNLVV